MTSGFLGVISSLISRCRVEVKVIGLELVVLLGKDVDGGFDQRVAAVVIEQAARNFFELLVADDFGIFRSDFVAHSRCRVEVKVIGLELVVLLGKDVDGGFDQRVAAVVVEQAARNFFELLVADDFGIFRSDFVAHSRCRVEVKVIGLELVVLLGKDVDGGFDQRVAAVVVEQAARNFFELLVADDFGIFRSDFVAHIVSIGWIRFANF